MAGFPSLIASDANQFSYGPKGEMSPESALKEQALNRRRQIANLLIQKGMAGSPGGKMVGRFYVADSPLQGAASLASVIAGGLGNMALDSQQKDIASADQKMVADAIKAYRDKMNGPQAEAGTPPPPAAAAPPQGGPLPPAPEQGPYNGEVGGIPQPDAGVQSAAPPIHTPPPALPDVGMTQSRGLDMSNVQPADMATAAQPSVEQAMPSPQAAAPMPPPPAAPPAPRKPAFDDLAELLTHQHPQVRAYGQLMAAMMQKQDDRAAQQEFLSGEKALDRDVRREGILENSRMREAQMQNTMALTQMQIDAKIQQGHDANELKATLAKQANDLQKLQMQTSAELKKAEIGSRTQTAKQHDETLKAIAGMNMEGRKEIASMKASTKDDAKLAEQEKSKKDVEGIIAVLRDSYNQLRTGGGVTDTSKGGLQNAGAAASSSAVGQALGKTFGTQNQSHRNTIAQQRPILMGNISKALGMSAKQLDSNAELKLWLNAATDPTLDYQTNMRALDQLESMLAGGGSTPSNPAQSGGPKAGTVEDGYRFKGGNPSDPNSWEKVK